MTENNRVYELAKVYGVASKELLVVLQEIGVDAKSHMSVLTDEDVNLLTKHMKSLETQGEAVAEKHPRFAVEKARPRQKRLSAKEKLAQKKAEQEARAKARAEAKAKAEEAKPAPEPVEEPAPEKPRKVETVQAPQPKVPVVEAPAAEEKAPEPEAKVETPAPAVPARPKRPTLDLSKVAAAAARTRAQIADDTKTRKAAPVEMPKPRKKAPPRPAPPAQGGDAAQPKPIDPKAIRDSVRKAMARVDVPRGGGGQRGPARFERKRPGRRSREDKRERVAKQRARAEAQRADDTKVRLTEYMTVQELAQKLEAKPAELIGKLMGMGVMATMNQRLERDIMEVLIADYEELEVIWLDAESGEDVEIVIEEEDGEMVPRPPVVTVMGHVDHGKTTLLDHLRSTDVTAGEAGGITQHIGAYQVPTERGVITFLDTPGHEAFTAMRARGAKVTDIVIVVVAADDKVMPQTVEAIDHARASDCPIIIAVNKIDLPAADPGGVKQQLMQHNVLVEDFGGEVQAVEISAKKGLNMDALLEAIQLQAELLELTAVEEGMARGTIVEARKDPGRGAVFTVLVTRGTLKVGDSFVVGATYGRVRAMLDEHDQPVEEAGPSRPVVILGANDVPIAGDQFNVMKSEKEAREIASRRRQVQREQEMHVVRKAVNLETLFDEMQEREEQVELKLLIKGDVAGSVEAVADSLMGLSNEKVAVNVIRRGVGGISEDDVMLAAASDAIVIGFHLHPTPAIRNAAKEQGVDLRLYDIIYEAVEEVKAAMTGLLKPVEREVATGTVEVREVFKVPKIGLIAGSYVLEGHVKRNSRVRVIRDQVQIYEGTISSLKRFKEDAKDVQSGFECGIGIDRFNDVKVGDILEVFEIEEVAQEL